MSASTSRSRRGVRAEPQVLVDGEVGERAAPCGTCAMPARATFSGLVPSIERPSNRNDPRAGIMPDSARSVVVLPAPFAPRITTDFALVDGEVDAVQHLHRPVPRAQLRDFRAALTSRTFPGTPR